MFQFTQDLRFALRRLRKSPGFTATTVVILALGIGGTTVFFSVLHAVLLNPLPYPDSDRIYSLEEVERQTGEVPNGISEPTFRDWSTGLESFSTFAATRFDNFHLTGAQEPQQVRAALVNAEFFDLFGPQPTPGRQFTAEEYEVSSNNVVLLGRGVWLRQFGGQDDLSGQEIELDGETYAVVGVLPEGFQFPSWADIWLPLQDISSTDRKERRLASVHARLNEDSTPQQAAAEMATMAQVLRNAHPDSHETIDARLTPLIEQEVGEVRSTLLMLFGAMVGVLLIVCLNVAGLELARGLERRRELAVRSALGAGRYRVMREMVTESLVFATLGGGAGLLLAWWGFDLIVALAPAGIPRLNEIQLAPPVLAFALGATLLTSLAAGALPAWSSTRFQLDDALRTDSSKHSGKGPKLRSALVVAQVALTVVLLTSAGLLIGSLRQLLATDPGYDADRMLSVGLVLPPNLYTEPHQRLTFLEQVKSRLEALPEVEQVVAANSLPWAGFSGRALEFETLHATEQASRHRGEGFEKAVSEGFFEALGVPLLAGRTFDSRDAEADGGGIETVVINETLARAAWPTHKGQPLGEQIEILIPGGEPFTVEVGGVVADVGFSGPTEPVQPQVFRSFERFPWSYFNLAARSTDGNTAQLLDTLRRTVWEIDPGRPIFNEITATQTLDSVLERPRFGALLLSTFAAVALLLAAVGIYGLMAFLVNRRGREIGIRRALGAQRGTVRWMVLREGMGLVALGIALGVPSAWLATRLLEGLLFGVTPGEPLIFAATLVLLASVSWLAIHLPATRASRIEPMTALREE